MVNKNILFENFAGRATPLQKKIIAEWLLEPEHMELYYEWLNEWENNNQQFDADDQAAIKRVLDNRGEETPHHNKMQLKAIIYRWLTSRIFAASVIVLLSVIGYYLFRDTIMYKRINTHYGETRLVTLPDGSLVTMNSNSVIKFPRFGFNKNTREVSISGEADFWVVHTISNQQFVVKTNNQLDVTVLGTQFTVYARESQSKVVLEKGKVELSYITEKVKKKLVMLPGNLFIAHSNGTSQMKQVEHPERLAAWKNHDFLFDAT
ncbi:MAG: FecR family protein, partial [Segetibacter sp.]